MGCCTSALAVVDMVPFFVEANPYARGRHRARHQPQR
ncbi:hypothetical protein GZL_01120 [Streptomyces sp. 769]|nr:hypothetical protein GZL_01120 [Streptomyces sp. 769]